MRGLEEIVAVGDDADDHRGRRCAPARKPTAPGLAELADRLSRPARDPGQGRPGQAQGQDRVEFASLDDLRADRRRSWTRATATTGRSSHLATNQQIDLSTNRLGDTSATISAPTVRRRRAWQPASAARRRRLLGVELGCAPRASGRCRRTEAGSHQLPAGCSSARVRRDRLVEQRRQGVVQRRGLGDRVVAGRGAAATPTRIGDRLAAREVPGVVLGHHPLGAPQHHRDQGNAGLGGDPGRPGLELLDLEGRARSSPRGRSRPPRPRRR